SPRPDGWGLSAMLPCVSSQEKSEQCRLFRCEKPEFLPVKELFLGFSLAREAYDRSLKERIEGEAYESGSVSPSHSPSWPDAAGGAGSGRPAGGRRTALGDGRAPFHPGRGHQPRPVDPLCRLPPGGILTPEAGARDPLRS